MYSIGFTYLLMQFKIVISVFSVFFPNFFIQWETSTLLDIIFSFLFTIYIIMELVGDWSSFLGT